MYELNICHLYPELMGLYGDSGNITALCRRLEWRGMQANVTDLPAGMAFESEKYDIIFFGGGQDFDRELVLADLESGKGEAITRAVESGKVVLAVSGGYQLLGKGFTAADGTEYKYIGALDVHTVEQPQRMTGDILFSSQVFPGCENIVGFENHSGMTVLGQGVEPLGTVKVGHGNGTEDKSEGARYKNTFCSYAHGPLLPKNPALCDGILKLALEQKYGSGIELAPLDDSFETQANAVMVKRLSEK